MNPYMLNIAIQQPFNPMRFWFEFAYTIIAIILFLFIFYKTKDLFKLTKHKGIKYFRIAFLFFSLAFISRFIFFLVRMVVMQNSIHIPGKNLSLISLVFITYFSTLAIGYLIYSSVWKKLRYLYFILIINLLSILSILIFYSRLLLIYMIIIQIILIIIILFINVKKNIGFIYSSLSLFWIFNLIIFHSRRLLSFEIKLIFQIMSIILLGYLVYRILKWTK